MKSQISALALCALALGGCVSLPDRPPVAPAMPSWTARAPGQSDKPVVLDWWTAFQDPALNALVENALAHNADLKAAEANLAAASALVGEVKAHRIPGGSLDAGVARGRVAGLSQPPFPGAPERYPTQTLANVGATLGWEVDVFGRISAKVAAARAQQGEALWLRRQTEAAVAAAVVRAYVEHRYAVQQESLLIERLAVLATIATSVEKSQALGAASQLDRQAATETLAQARAQLMVLSAEHRNAARRLAVLSGRAPDPNLPAGRLPITPAVLDAGDPTAMLRRRPDVGAAEQRLAAAVADARIAVTDLYPRVSVGGNIALSSKPNRLGDDGSLGFSVGPSLSWGLFDMPRLLKRVEAADARSQAALGQWQAVVLTALEEADGAIETWGASRDAARQTGLAAQATDTRLGLMAKREAAGQISARTRLEAQAQALDARSAALDARGREAQGWIAAQLSLGAGWRDAALGGEHHAVAEAAR
jgi:NodT family efflux transporter outer membrane factor (OMF) lipoprotein